MIIDKLTSLFVFHILLLICKPSLANTDSLIDKIVPLTIHGENFAAPTGEKVRFWGVNLTSFYPTHDIADQTAKNLASLGVNMVRPHHMMRKSLDWNPQMKSGALVDYKDSSRQFDEDALDKFDYLNAVLRKQGIYLALSLTWTRFYHQGDVKILDTTPEDEAAWTQAWKEIESWNWRKQFDVVKTLSLIDERFIAIDEEFTTSLLEHVNPYTNRSYAQDPQVATIEVINEYGAEYTFVNKHRLPLYFHNKLQQKWDAFSKANNVKVSEFYTPKTLQQRRLRMDFLRSLDEDRMIRLTQVARNLGYKGAMTYSNLYRGDNHLALHEKLADFIEDHTYANPFVADNKEDLFYFKSKSLIKDKPYIIGEFNISENKDIQEKQRNKRTMLTASAVAYASLHNWSGITWFSWQHGTRKVGTDGWSIYPDREPSIGDLVKDQMQLDHFRTASTIFRNGYIASATPEIMFVDSPYQYDNYHQLVAGKYQFKPGWQSIFPIRKTFAPTTPEVLEAQKSAQWMTQSPPSPLISATNQIIKDIERKQLTASSDKAEIFSGYLDEQPPAGLRFMQFEKNTGFATVMLTSNDGADLVDSASLLISKTYVELDGGWFSEEEKESDALPIILNTGAANKHWKLTITRPLSHQKTISLTTDEYGKMKLPELPWFEVKLFNYK